MVGIATMTRAYVDAVPASRAGKTRSVADLGGVPESRRRAAPT
jgi:hypothetical protein